MLTRSISWMILPVARPKAFSTSAGRIVTGMSRPTRPLARGRFRSTSSESGSSSRSFGASHVAAGVAGGLTVVLAGYAWYHTSGLKNVIQSAKEMRGYLQSTRDRFLSKANESSKNPSQALSHLRNIAKSYTFLIPGAATYIDDTFDDLELLYDTHKDDMDAILKETTEEIINATQTRRGTDTKAALETAKNVYEIVGRGIGRMKEVGRKAGNDILDRNPVVREKLGGAYEQLVSLAGKAGLEGKEAVREASEQVKELASRASVDEGSVKRVRDLIQRRTSNLRKRVDNSDAEAESVDTDAEVEKEKK